MAEGKKAAAEVMVRLVVDSNAKQATDDLKQHVAGTQVHAQKTGGKIGAALATGLSGAGMLIKGAIGLQIAAATAAVGGLVAAAEKSIEAFQGSAKQVKEIAGTLTLIDQRGNSFADLKGYAADLKDELEDVAIQYGTTDDTAVAMFNDIIERGGKTIDQTKELTSQMILAGRAFPGGPESLAEGFSMMQMGMIRARNPIVQMIAATHTLKGNAKQVAAELQKMTLDKQMEVAEKAIGAMAGKMKAVPMTMGEMKKSMGVAWENVFETAGEPMVKAMAPIVGKARELLLEFMPQLTDGAKEFGGFVAKGFEIALDVINEVVSAIRVNQKEMKEAVQAFRDLVDPVFKYIYENRHALAKTFADIAMVLIKAFTWIAKTMASVYAGIGSILKSIGKVVPGLGDFIREEDRTAAVNKVGTTVKAGGAMSDKEFEAQRSAFVKLAVEAGRNAEDANAEFASIYRRAMDDHLATMKQVEGARDAALTDDAAKFAAAFQTAAKANDAGAEKYVAEFLRDNMSLQNALEKAGPDIFGAGFEQFIATLKDIDLGDAAKKLAGKKVDLGIPSKPNITQNFNGPINVKQDFRDQDPDRVAVVFRDDLARVGTNRLQSRFASPFGF